MFLTAFGDIRKIWCSETRVVSHETDAVLASKKAGCGRVISLQSGRGRPSTDFAIGSARRWLCRLADGRGQRFKVLGGGLTVEQGICWVYRFRAAKHLHSACVVGLSVCAVKLCIADWRAWLVFGRVDLGS